MSLNSVTFNIQNIIAFIDGKNMVCRFQEMVADKFNSMDQYNKLVPTIEFEKDKFIWKKDLTIDFPSLGYNKRFDIIRAYYYTFCDQTNLQTLSEKISKVSITSYSPLTLNPIILHGTKASRDFKGDDIQMCIDAIDHATNSNIEAYYLFTGDGDFLPLIEKLQKMGKYVFIGAFSKGLNPRLQTKADYFFCLDEKFGFGGVKE